MSIFISQYKFKIVWRFRKEFSWSQQFFDFSILYHLCEPVKVSFVVFNCINQRIKRLAPCIFTCKYLDRNNDVINVAKIYMFNSVQDTMFTWSYPAFSLLLLPWKWHLLLVSTVILGSKQKRRWVLLLVVALLER